MNQGVQGGAWLVSKLEEGGGRQGRRAPGKTMHIVPETPRSTDALHLQNSEKSVCDACSQDGVIP